MLLQLAAAEAEAEALRKELSARRAAAGKDVDISKLKPATPEKRIDGTGFRETILPLQAKPKTGTGTCSFRLLLLDARPAWGCAYSFCYRCPGSSRQQQFNRWSLSETELFLSKGAPTEGTGLGVPALEDGSDELVRRRLVLGCGLALVAVGAALVCETILWFPPCFTVLSSWLQVPGLRVFSLSVSIRSGSQLKGLRSLCSFM